MNLFVLNRKSKEELLVDRLKKNDALAQKELYQQSSKKMLSVCRSYIEDMHYAEDCMINGFCKVFNHIQKFQNKGSFEGWVRRIMVNECLTFLRSNKTLIYVDDNRIADYDEVDDEVDNEWLDFNVQEVLDQLSEPYRLVFNLHILEDYSHQEIAEMLNISVSTSKTQLFRAKAKLKEIVLSQKKKRNEKEG
ncbi:RNA polymerase sigma-70 factor, ECF subfamily [Algoriella xinjiangensis]|uniref:RNA polymerase sigma-70 factor, ECF subfamily n=1 Tax=Algoriella xinjiangensis TaxID=684065 RepID=A0A1I4XLY6_9FLAO|nr:MULTISPECIES: RNA polymerase sigma factor [Algoriella]MBO6212218.1 RNA polymerase sigma factor [Algoriella sp.]SFN26443.1 RNA polymerase sigma-70 factor, ECF subfamily [Algoriella xinjiangensis]VDH17691.1 RNA polymerase sigma factor sigV [Algoriella xinjiangensis]